MPAAIELTKNNKRKDLYGLSQALARSWATLVEKLIRH